MEEKLTPHFTLEELCATSHKDLQEENLESGRAIKGQLIRLAEWLEEIREEIGCPMMITSGYRSAGLNRRVGGSATSQHLKGEAVDFIPQCRDLEAALYRAALGPADYGQLILEDRGRRIIHISMGDKRQIMYSPTPHEFIPKSHCEYLSRILDQYGVSVFPEGHNRGGEPILNPNSPEYKARTEHGKEK